MSIASLSVRQPTLMNLLMMLVIVGGIFSYTNMPQDRFPDVSVETIIVTTVMPGASPKEMEQLITIPLEEEIAKVDEIDEMTSTSADGVSTIVLEMEPGIENFFEKITEVQNQIELVEDFPDEAEPPVVTEIKVAFDTITLAILGTAPEKEIKEFVEDFESELKIIPGVEEVDIAGLREREIWVEADPHRLHAYGLSLNDVSNALRRRNLNLPGGTIKMGRGEFNVRTEAEFGDLDAMLGTVVKEDGQHGYVYVRDIATVIDTFEDRQSLARYNGDPSINITVKKDKKSNAIEVVKNVRTVLAEFEQRLPAGLHFEVVDDSSVEIKDRLKSLYQNMGLGLVLVSLAFTVFIGWRPALMVATGMPVALIGTFIFLNALGLSVNMLVLFGLILVTGMVCDDAIVVCENVYRHIEAGLPVREAVMKGVDEIMWPVIATVTTTVAAFLPLLLMTGVLGKFMSVIPIAVSFALLCSLIECFLILPAHIVDWGGHIKHDGSQKQHKRRPWFEFLTRAYERLIAIALKLRYLTLAATVAVAVLMLNIAFTKMDFILFGGRDLQSFSVEVEGPPGASLEETTRLLSELEERALAIKENTPEIKSITLRSGTISRGNVGGMSGSNVGQVSFRLVLPSERTRSGHEIKDEVREAIKDVPGARTITIEDSRDGPPVGKAVQVRIKGDNFDTLKEISNQVQAFLREQPGVKDVMDNFPPGKDEVRPVLDMERVAGLGLNVQTIATEIRGAFDGLEATRIHDGNEEIEVMVKFNEANRRSIASLNEMQFATMDGMVPFSNFARMERQPGYSAISHHNQKRTVNVLADVVEGEMTSQRANRLVMENFADIPDRYPGYSLDFGGEFQDTQESLASMMKAFVIAMLAIYVILGGLFASFVQPFIVMVSIPFAFIGVVLGFYMLDLPLGMFAIIGVIALCGIVVNDALVLIDFINSERRMGVERRASICKAGAVRLRAVFLTSITTISGLAPMSLGLFGVDDFMRPMATAIAWGLTFATVLTLVVVPCVYAIFDDFSMLILRHPLGITREQYREMRKTAEAAAKPALEPEPAQS